MRLALAAQLSIIAVATAICTDAHAIERQHHIGLDPTLAMLKVDDKPTVSIGGGLGLHYTYGINDQFNFMAELNGSVVATDEEVETPTTPLTRPTNVAHATAGVGYVIDILQFVPYLGLLVGGYRLAGGTLQDPLILPGAEIALGLDYQLSRHWAIGLGLRQHLLFTKLSTYPSYSTLLLRFEYMWGY